MSRDVREKSLKQLLSETSLDDSFVLGYYGGGNYGDELLMEVLQHIFKIYGYQTVNFLYQKPADIRRFHEDLGYQPIDASDKVTIIRTILRRKNLIIGGGGLWGLDVNLNIVLMSVMLFAARWLLGKKVYLIGVGYYGSTGRMGRFAARLAGKAASQILARDPESYRNFSAINGNVYLTDDIAFNLPQIDRQPLKTTNLERAFDSLQGNVLFISVRRFKPGQANRYADVIEQWLRVHPDQPVILSLMEPREVDPEGYERVLSWQSEHPHAAIIDFDYNPIELYDFFHRHASRLAFIGPQFHVQLVAHLAGVPLLPLVYDNKVRELLHKLRYSDLVPIAEVSARHIDHFLNERAKSDKVHL